MKALIKFADVRNIDDLLKNEVNLAPELSERILTMGLKGMDEYFNVLLTNPKFSTVPADFETLKHLDKGDTITFSNFAVDWLDSNNVPLANWFHVEPDSLSFYTLDLQCEVIAKGIVGNIFVLSVIVMDIGYVATVG
ncbi:hypothetical protein AAKU52_002579 [Pedobacter sp. CG_S7]|uniref:hypothetical protein n=1 Tax=Pedobacter sp. CG_S7 TaxID=3143930 RepID=UPI003393323C